MMYEFQRWTTCPGLTCVVDIGHPHLDGCHVARCLISGGQLLMCSILKRHAGDHVSDTWTGYWPGDVEAAAFGWWCRWVDGEGWMQCQFDTPGARPDLNRLAVEANWDPSIQSWTVHPSRIIVDNNGGT